MRLDGWSLWAPGDHPEPYTLRVNLSKVISDAAIGPIKASLAAADAGLAVAAMALGQVRKSLGDDDARYADPITDLLPLRGAIIGANRVAELTAGQALGHRDVAGQHVGAVQHEHLAVGRVVGVADVGHGAPGHVAQQLADERLEGGQEVVADREARGVAEALRGLGDAEAAVQRLGSGAETPSPEALEGWARELRDRNFMKIVSLAEEVV